jgi:hypothetical protein
MGVVVWDSSSNDVSIGINQLEALDKEEFQESRLMATADNAKSPACQNSSSIFTYAGPIARRNIAALARKNNYGNGHR